MTARPSKVIEWCLKLAIMWFTNTTLLIDKHMLICMLDYLFLCSYFSLHNSGLWLFATIMRYCKIWVISRHKLLLFAFHGATVIPPTLLSELLPTSKNTLQKLGYHFQGGENRAMYFCCVCCLLRRIIIAAILIRSMYHTIYAYCFVYSKITCEMMWHTHPMFQDCLVCLMVVGQIGIFLIMVLAYC